MTKTPVPRNRQPLTAERLRELLHYEPTTGVFTWRTLRPGRSPMGGIAGSVRKNPKDPCFGYRFITVDHFRTGAHRLAWFYVKGAWPPGDLDHQNMVRDDNRIDNLREATRSQNMANAGRPRHNTSGLKGASFLRATGKWQAQIQFHGKNLNLGSFASAEEAHEAYCQAGKRLFGEFFRAT
jgi:hypothetical protein